MAAPEFYDRVLEPPRPGMTDDEKFRWLYDLWRRTGGYINFIPNLFGLQASVEELNTLVGIDTNFTVQAQLNSKADAVDLGTMASQNANNVNITGGVLDGVDITNSSVSGDLAVTVGTSLVSATVGASLNTNITAVSNVNAGETTLMNYTLQANMLGNNGDYIDIDAYGTFAANANNKRIRLYFGATVIFDTTAIAANAGSWWIKGKIAREALADQQAITSIISSNALVTPTTSFTDPSESLGGTVLIKVTGLGVASNDITQQGFDVKWFAAA